MRAMTMAAMVAMSACAQSQLGTTTSGSIAGNGDFGSNGAGPTTTSGNGGNTTTASTGTSAQTTGTGSGSSTSGSPTTTATTGANCSQSGSSSPALTCALAATDVTPAVASQAVEIDCTLGAGQAPFGYDVTTTPAFTYIDTSQAVSAGKIWVTLQPAMLPTIFPDSTLTATITAHFCNSSPSSSTASWPVIGNTLVADAATSIRTFASDSTELTPFLGPTQVPSPSLIYQMHDGNFLAGCFQSNSSTSCTHALQVFTPAGMLVSHFDDADHTGTPLWPSMVRPFAAAEDPNGNVWVSGYQGQDQAGVLLQFSSAGGYLTAPSPPADPNEQLGSWVPLGIGVLSDGSMIVAMGGAEGDTPLLTRYVNADPTMPSLVPLGWETCTDTGGSTPSCGNQDFATGNAAGILVNGSTVLVASTFDEPSQILSYSNPGLALTGASAEPSSQVDDWGNDFLAQITPFGNGYLVTSILTYNCIYLVSGTTLYPPASTTAQEGCWLGNSTQATVEGILHLTAG